MYLTRVTEINQLRELRNQWDSLLFSGESTPLPLTHGWITAWWNEFNSNKSLRIFCVYNDAQELIAIAPFYEEKVSYRGIPIQQLHLLSDGHSPYSDLIYSGTLSLEKIAEILNFIIKENWNDLIVFAKIPKTSPTYACLVDPINTGNYNVVIKDNLLTPTILISGEWSDFFKNRSRKFKKSINNKLNRFKKEPDFEINCETITSAHHPVLNEIVEISKKSWKFHIKKDLSSDKAGKKFLLSLVEIFGINNHVQVWILRKNAIPVAYEFHMIFDNIAYPIRADYDEDYKKYSPGSILEYTVLKHLFEKQCVAEYYTCADNYWYLNNWSNDLIEHYTVEVFSSTIKAQLLYFIETRIIPTAKSIRKKLQSKREQTIYFANDKPSK